MDVVQNSRPLRYSSWAVDTIVRRRNPIKNTILLIALFISYLFK